MFSAIKSHESVVEMLVSKSVHIDPSFHTSIPRDELMNRYQSLHDRAKVRFQDSVHLLN